MVGLNSTAPGRISENRNMAAMVLTLDNGSLGVNCVESSWMIHYLYGVRGTPLSGPSRSSSENRGFMLTVTSERG